jgi:hypothetical protein
MTLLQQNSLNSHIHQILDTDSITLQRHSTWEAIFVVCELSPPLITFAPSFPSIAKEKRGEKSSDHWPPSSMILFET